MRIDPRAIIPLYEQIKRAYNFAQDNAVKFDNLIVELSDDLPPADQRVYCPDGDMTGERGGKFRLKGAKKEDDFKDLNPNAIYSPKELVDTLKRYERSVVGKKVSIASTKDLEIILSAGTYALISAGKNPKSESDANLPGKEFYNRSVNLARDLGQLGYKYTPVVGKYGEVEDSYLVMVHDSQIPDMVALGEKYNQDAIIVSDKGQHKQIYTSESYDEDAAGNRTPIPKGSFYSGGGYTNVSKDESDFYTEVKTGDGTSRFSLNINFDSDKLTKPSP